MMFRGKNRRGNAVVEFAVASAILLPSLSGTFQFGFSFYRYNLLQTAVTNGGMYGAYRTYRCASGSTDIAKVKAAIQNMTVYGTPAPSGTPVPVVPGLKPSDVEVTYTLTSLQIPTAVTVKVKNYKMKALFQDYTVSGKPKYTATYLGRYAPEESEP